MIHRRELSRQSKNGEPQTANPISKKKPETFTKHSNQKKEFNMTSHITHLHQLPHKLQAEIASHLGSIAGMSQIQIVARYRQVAEWLKSVKLSGVPHGYEAGPGHLTAQEFDNINPNPPGVAPEFTKIFVELIAYESVWYLGNFSQQLAALEHHLNELARQEAARQLAQRQAEEAARQEAQRRAEEAARLHAQRLAEEAARQVAARQLAEQQALAAAQALAQQKAEEAALRDARLKLELASATEDESALENGEIAAGASTGIGFIPGPAALSEIDRATLVLKHSIESAITLYASAIAPYFNNPTDSVIAH
jgi:hypothetical protein